MLAKIFIVLYTTIQECSLVLFDLPQKLLTMDIFNPYILSRYYTAFILFSYLLKFI